MADIPLTLSDANAHRLSAEESIANGGATWRIRTTYEDFNGTNYTNSSVSDGETITHTSISTPADYLVAEVWAVVTTAFTESSGDGTLTFDVGTATVDAFIDGAEAETAGPYIGALGALPVDATAAGKDKGTTSVPIKIRMITNTNKPSEINAGVLDVYLRLIDCSMTPAV